MRKLSREKSLCYKNERILSVKTQITNKCQNCPEGAGIFFIEERAEGIVGGFEIDQHFSY